MGARVLAKNSEKELGRRVITRCFEPGVWTKILNKSCNKIYEKSCEPICEQSCEQTKGKKYLLTRLVNKTHGQTCE